MKFESHLDWFKIWKFQTWLWQKLKKSISWLPNLVHKKSTSTRLLEAGTNYFIKTRQAGW